MTQLPYPTTHEEVLELKREYKKKSAAKKIEKMHLLYGRQENPMMSCADCRHCIGRYFSKTYWKCELYGISGGSATDWNRKWPACGRFESRICAMRKAK